MKPIDLGYDMPLARFLTVVVTFAAWLLATACCPAQSTDPFPDHARVAAAAYGMHVDSSPRRKLELQPEPILGWTNPVPEKQMRGEVFLWTDDGRPAAVLNVFQMNEGNGPQECHEFCSLANIGLVANNPANRNWSPTTSQVTMATVSDAPLPPQNPRQRFTQMRNVATRFTCQKTNRKGEVQTLRLLPQPLIRYESQTHDVVDGGLFTFVEATDPEAFLLLEVRPVGDSLQWHFGFARMASVQMQASRDNKHVWEVETLPFDGYRVRCPRSRVSKNTPAGIPSPCS